MSKSSADFLIELEKQAELQSKIYRKRLLPARLDFLTAFIGNYPWQILLFLSGVTSLAVSWPM
jgi:hypothetical protein